MHDDRQVYKFFILLIVTTYDHGWVEITTNVQFRKTKKKQKESLCCKVIKKKVVGINQGRKKEKVNRYPLNQKKKKKKE